MQKCPFDNSLHLNLTDVFNHLKKCLRGKDKTIYLCRHEYTHIFQSMEQLEAHEKICPNRLGCPEGNSPVVISCRVQKESLEALGQTLAKYGFIENPSIPLPVPVNDEKLTQVDNSPPPKGLKLASDVTVNKFELTQPKLEYKTVSQSIMNPSLANLKKHFPVSFSIKFDLKVLEPSTGQVNPVNFKTNDKCESFKYYSGLLYSKTPNQTLQYIFSYLNLRDMIVVERIICSYIPELDRSSLIASFLDETFLVHQYNFDDKLPHCQFLAKNEVVLFKINNCERFFHCLLSEFWRLASPLENMLSVIEELSVRIEHKKEEKETRKEQFDQRAEILSQLQREMASFSIEDEKRKILKLKKKLNDLTIEKDNRIASRNSMIGKNPKELDQLINETFGDAQIQSKKILKSFEDERKDVEKSNKVKVEEVAQLQQKLENKSKEASTRAAEIKDYKRQIKTLQTKTRDLLSQKEKGHKIGTQAIELEKIQAKERMRNFENVCENCRTDFVNLLHYPCKHWSDKCAKCWHELGAYPRCEICLEFIEKFLVIRI